MRHIEIVGVALLLLAGCVSMDEAAVAARNEVVNHRYDAPIAWSEKLIEDSSYSRNWGLLEAGRINMLAGNHEKALRYFREAVDSAVDRNEASPKLKLSDVGNTVLAGTITDDRTREYYLSPYELNLALEYSILLQAMQGDFDAARVDSRLAVYVQDSLVETYGADLENNRKNAKKGTSEVLAKESEYMSDLMEGTRNSYESALLWYLTGLMFEADPQEDYEMARKSYEKAYAIMPENKVFERAAKKPSRMAPGMCKMVYLYEDGFVPMRKSVKVPVPIYTAMSIDIPSYREASANRASPLAKTKLVDKCEVELALDVRALAYRDLEEQLPGVITRNITRAATQIAAQAAANHAGNGYVQLAVFAGNAVVSAIRRADTRSWITIPKAQYVWEAEVPAFDGIKPGQVKIIWYHN